jgi:formate-dependent nitrite reductase cytochrome c552 subunit
MKPKLAIGIGLATVLWVGFVLPAGCPTTPTPTPGGTGDSGVTGQFVGADTCALCHKNIHDSWALTLHSQALNKLEGVEEGTNPDCLLCHTVGFNQDGGFVDRATTNALAGVQCESCHGPARAHVQNVADATLRPPVNISANVCSQCHNAFHHALYSEWKSSLHSTVTDVPADDFINGQMASNCGVCHSGDVRELAFVQNQPVPDTLLQGKSKSELNAVVCVTCHDPHARTNRAFLPPAGHDFQLRYAEVVPFPSASNTIAATTDPDRFNLCGQCHHSRDATWQATSRGPHPSVQSNFYVGEMPVPDGTAALLPNQRTVHAFVPRQCVTCHMQFEVEAGLVSMTGANHQFTVESFDGCVATGCHPSAGSAENDKKSLQHDIQVGLNHIKSRLGSTATWEYSANGGPADQSTVSDEVKQIRFLYYYVLDDKSLGVHNPEYARAIIARAGELLTSIGL